MKSVNKRGKQIAKSTAVMYDDTLGGVDKVDQHIADNPVTWKEEKYKSIFPPCWIVECFHDLQEIW